ncbi:MAG: hypothetical protein WDN06_01290 [Asticcacaulis sp.]
MWSLPDGRSLRVVRQPHPLGGLLILFSDKTGELKLKAQFNALIQVQKSTLDQLNDAVSVYGSDGRLRLRNQAFDKFWQLAPEDISGVVDFTNIAELCLPLVHDRGFWTELKARVTDTDPLARRAAIGRNQDFRRPPGRNGAPSPCRTAPPWSPFPTSPPRANWKRPSRRETRRWANPSDSSAISSPMSPMNCAHP